MTRRASFDCPARATRRDRNGWERKSLCHSEEGGNRGGASTAGRGAGGSHPTIGICMFEIIIDVVCVAFEYHAVNGPKEE